MRRFIVSITLLFSFTLIELSFASEVYGKPQYFGDYAIDKNTKLSIYSYGFVAYTIKGNDIYKAGSMFPLYTIDGKYIKRANIMDRISHPAWSFDKTYIYNAFGSPVYKIKGNQICGGFGFMNCKYTIKKSH